MDPNIVIRSETEADARAIGEVTAAAFETLEISNHTEQFIVEAVRAAGALAVSLSCLHPSYLPKGRNVRIGNRYLPSRDYCV